MICHDEQIEGEFVRGCGEEKSESSDGETYQEPNKKKDEEEEEEMNS